MFTNSIEDLELISGGGLSFAFPVTGQAGSAAVYFELEPGARLNTHTDSGEELLYLLQGSVEATVGDETGRLEAGDLAVVPANAPHGVLNDGDETARVLGFFATGTVYSVFEEPPVPGGPTHVVNGMPFVPLELPVEVPA